MKSEKLSSTICFADGEKVCLEPFSFKRMLKFYALYKTSREKWEQFITLRFKTLDDVKKFIAQQTQEDAFVGYFILEKKSHKLVGFMLGDEISDSEIAFTYAIASQYEGLGYAYEARKLFEQVLAEAGYASIKGICDANNVRNRELLLRDGYRKETSQLVPMGATFVELEVYSKNL